MILKLFLIVGLIYTVQALESIEDFGAIVTLSHVRPFFRDLNPANATISCYKRFTEPYKKFIKKIFVSLKNLAEKVDENVYELTNKGIKELVPKLYTKLHDLPEILKIYQYNMAIYFKRRLFRGFLTEIKNVSKKVNLYDFLIINDMNLLKKYSVEGEGFYEMYEEICNEAKVEAKRLFKKFKICATRLLF